MIMALAAPGMATWQRTNVANTLVTLQIAPAIGGRIIQYKLGDYAFFWENDQLLATDPPDSGLGPNDSFLNYGGDKLWPAPQGWDNDEQWPGPPDAVLDGQPYRFEQLKSDSSVKSFRLTSREDKRSGIQFIRQVTLSEGATRVIQSVTMKNIDTKPRRWGIWAVTQFNTANRHGEGYNKKFYTYCPMNPKSIFPKGFDNLYGLVSEPSFTPDYKNQMLRMNYQWRVGKVGIDNPAGWIATVDAADGYAFVHRFKYEPSKPYPDNSSVEFWANGVGNFIAWGKEVKCEADAKATPYFLESEILSPFARLLPGESYTFNYEWAAAKIAPDLAVRDCKEVGVICIPLTVKQSSSGFALSGSFGVFYDGAARLAFISPSGRKTEALGASVEVSPLNALDLSQTPGLTDGVIVPAGAKAIAILVYDKQGKMRGELARAPL
jgi:hypothetical protein